MKKFLFNIMATASVLVIVIFYYGTGLIINADNNNFALEQLASEAEVYGILFDEFGETYFEENDSGFSDAVSIISVSDFSEELPKDVQEALLNGSGFNKDYDSKGNLKYYYSVQINSGEIIRTNTDAQTLFSIMVELLPWVFIILVLLLLAVDIFCENITKTMANKINSINIKKPTQSGLYDELAPLVKAINERQELTAKRKAMLAQKQNEFEVIIENMAEGLIVIDNKADVLSVNKSAIVMCGETKKFENGNSVYLLNRDLVFFAAVEKALMGDKSEFNHSLAGKTYRFFLNPVKIDGESFGAVIIIMDVTETESRESLRREFAANVSHELKTPLTSISGYAELIKTGIAKAKDVPSFADKIYLEAQRMISLVSDIIKISRLDEGDENLIREKCDLFAISNDVCDRLENTAQNSDVSIEITGEKLNIIGIKPVLEEMIYNLCENAIKYNKKGGKVTVSVLKLQNKAIVSVSDTGVGIPISDQGRIFERFYRVDKSHSRETGGTGLGLSIVKHGARLNGGEIHLTSEEGKGTNITIDFDI